MDDKVIKIDNWGEVYRKVAENKEEEGDVLGKLAFLLNACKQQASLDAIMDVADLYSEMGLLELSNKYLFLFLDKAPKERQSEAYLSLATNFFYLENLWASSYFFHKKVSTDGFIAQEGLDQEVLDFFSENVDDKSQYRIVYPFNEADYSKQFKGGKRALANGDVKTAQKIYESVPTECLTEEVQGEYAMACFLDGNEDKAIKVCRDSLDKHGENITAYCNLSSAYSIKNDSEKSAYYYKKALELLSDNVEDYYKIATCAIEQNDHVTVEKSVKKILEDRDNDINMLFFYGVAQINLKNYEKAFENFSLALRLNPDDAVIDYYAKLSLKLISGENFDDILPLKYVKDLPKEVVKKYKRKLQELSANPNKISSALNRVENKDLLSYCVCSHDTTLKKNSVYVLSECKSKFSVELLLSTLLNPDCDDDVKRFIIYVLIADGYTEKFGVVAGFFFQKIRARKLSFREDPLARHFVSAYAMSIARTVFTGIEDIDKLGFSINNIYKKMANLIDFEEYSIEEVGALNVLVSNFKGANDVGIIAQLFGVKREKLNKLFSMYKGEQNG